MSYSEQEKAEALFTQQAADEIVAILSELYFSKGTVARGVDEISVTLIAAAWRAQRQFSGEGARMLFVDSLRRSADRIEAGEI